MIPLPPVPPALPVATPLLYQCKETSLINRRRVFPSKVAFEYGRISFLCNYGLVYMEISYKMDDK